MAGRTNSQQTARTAVKSGRAAGAAPRPVADPPGPAAAAPPQRARPSGKAREETAGPDGRARAQARDGRARAAGGGRVPVRGLARRRRRGRAGTGFCCRAWLRVWPPGPRGADRLAGHGGDHRFDVTVRRSYWFIGALVFLFGLFLLVAAGVPPFGRHGADYFVRAEFEGRAGGLGEATYALLHGLAGTVGVAIIGWVAVVAGLSLATGMTVGRLAAGTRQAAGAVRDYGRTRRHGGQGSRRERARSGRLAGYFLAAATAADGTGASSAHHLGWPRLGPVDLVGDGLGTAQSLWPADRATNPFGQEFDEWSDGQPAERSPLAPRGIDGVRYGGPGWSTSVRRPLSARRGGTTAVGAPRLPGVEAAAGSSRRGGRRCGRPVSPRRAAAKPAARLSTSGTAADESVERRAGRRPRRSKLGQEALPGLGRAPRQTELPVDAPDYLLPDAELLKKSTPLAPGRAERTRYRGRGTRGPGPVRCRGASRGHGGGPPGDPVRAAAWRRGPRWPRCRR